MASGGLKIKNRARSKVNFNLESIYFAMELIKMSENTCFGKNDGKMKLQLKIGINYGRVLA